MSGGNLCYNVANGDTEANGGGGIYNNSSFVMSGGAIYSNIAQTDTGANKAVGGGVFNAGTMKMYNDALIGDKLSGSKADTSNYSNYAKRGGGIYNTGTLDMGTSTYELTGGIYYNTSQSEDGGGIYISLNSGVVTILSGCVLNNNQGIYNAGIASNYVCAYKTDGSKIQQD